MKHVSDLRVGDKIEIDYMEGEPQYTGKTGIVTSIDSLGQAHGTWGGCAVCRAYGDKYTIISSATEVEEEVEVKKCCLCGKPLGKYGNNPWPLGPEDDDTAECCDECNIKYVMPARIRAL